ncbi:MAG: response regulator [Chloroflexi bacterium]|nr:MAG: response regulator [Chloroflexota bacterium]
MMQPVNSQPKVLYAEDEAQLRQLVATMLEILGYDVTVASNGKVATEKAADWQPDVIIMDVRMPVMNGPEAIKIIRSDPRTAHIPVLVLSANTDARTREMCRLAGANKFFAKPIGMKQINVAIREALKTPQLAD